MNVVFTPYLPLRVLDSGMAAHSVKQNRTGLRMMKVWEKHLSRVKVASFNKDVGVLNPKLGKVRVFIYIDMSFTWRLKYVIRVRTATKT